MEINEIKQQLTLARVLQHYGLKPDKNLRLHCPFHDDKTPSLQVYYKTHTCYCFSSNCKTHGRSIDVIDFILYKEHCTKHEAILKAVEIITYFEGKLQHQHNLPRPDGGKEESKSPAPSTLQRSAFLQNMFTYFKNAVHNSKPARDYLQSRCIDFKKTEVGYNAGQFHHGARKNETLIKQCIAYGLLLEAGLTARSGDAAYKPFGKCCVCFALRNQQNEILSLYFRSTLQDKAQRHFYLKDRQGLYPGYPKPETTKLILTESIIDAATLLQVLPFGKDLGWAVLALFGTNGLTEEHQEAIRKWLIPSPSGRVREGLEIIFFLNGDEPGSKAVAKYAPMFKAAYPSIKITSVEVPQGEDVNSLLQGHSADILTHLISTRKEFEFFLYPQDFSFSNGVRENASLSSTEKENQGAKLFIESEASQTPVKNNDDCLQTAQAKTITNVATEPTEQTTATGLNTNNPYNLQYQGNEALYQIKGFRVEQMDSLKITLQIQINP